MFILGAIIYLAYAWVVYSPFFKGRESQIWLGLVFALLGNLVWLNIARATQSTNAIAFRALVWDSMVTLAFILVPIAAFNLRFSYVSAIGCAITIIGLVMMKAGSA